MHLDPGNLSIFTIDPQQARESIANLILDRFFGVSRFWLERQNEGFSISTDIVADYREMIASKEFGCNPGFLPFFSLFEFATSDPVAERLFPLLFFMQLRFR